MRPYDVGKLFELHLARTLFNCGCITIVSPASGKRNNVFKPPDVVAVRDGRATFFEVKYRGDGRDIYIRRREFEEYRDIVRRSGSRLYICTFYSEIGYFKCLDLEDYDNITNKYVVYRRTSFYTRGKDPRKIVGCTSNVHKR